METLNKYEVQALEYGKEVLEAYQTGRDFPNVPHGMCMCSAHEKLMIKMWKLGQYHSQTMAVT